MIRTYRHFLAAAALATLIVMMAPVGTGTGTAAAGSCWSWKASEKKLARLTNQARMRRGKPKLRLDPELSKAAKVHTKLMATTGILQHTPSDTLAYRVTNWSILGENVGYGSSVHQVQRAFMNSPAHRENILKGRFRHVGIGIRTAGDTMWITVLFSGRENPGTRLSMPC